MTGKVDLVMWARNGADTLPAVFTRIDQVIPRSCVNLRIVVDDRSTDDTACISESFGWQVLPNDGTGISDGANTALNHVSAEFFVSFEQDLLLAYDWWAKIPAYLSASDVAAASGIRLPSRPSDLRKTMEFAIERQQRKTNHSEAFFAGKTLDNTVYKTRIVREVGGFPNLPIPAGTDNVLAQRFDEKGYRWQVDFTVKSLHLRKGLRDELKHYYWYGTCFNILIPLLSKKNLDMKPMILRLVFSPLRGLDIAIKKNAPGAIVIYPLTRLYLLRGIIVGRKTQICFNKDEIAERH